MPAHALISRPSTPHPTILFVLLTLALAALSACTAHKPWNESFPVRVHEARADLRSMSATPQTYDRPLVISGGFADTGIFTGFTVRRYRSMTPDRDQVISVRYLGTRSFDACAKRLIERIDEAFGSGDEHETIEVDVIAFSMGGLVARHAARPDGVDGRRLRIRTLFTIGTPHRGAWMAGLPALDQRQADMRAGSELLAQLDDALQHADYELVTYGRLNDLVVGDVTRMAPPDRTAWWLPAIPLTLPHSQSHLDPRIQSDILRRLRGLPPWTTSPPQAPP